MVATTPEQPQTLPAPARPWTGWARLLIGFLVAQIVLAIVSVPLLLIDNPGVWTKLQNALNSGESAMSAIADSIPEHPVVGGATILGGLIIPWIITAFFIWSWAKHPAVKVERQVVQTAIIDNTDPDAQTSKAQARRDAFARLGLTRITRTHVRKGVTIGLLATVAINLPLTLAAAAGWKPDTETNTDVLTSIHGLAGVIVVVLGATAIPFVEVLFFRGAFTAGLARRLSPVRSSVIAGAFFGIVHLTGIGAFQAANVLAVAVLGGVFSMIRLRHNTIMITFIAHMTFNTIGLVLAKYAGG